MKVSWADIFQNQELLKCLPNESFLALNDLQRLICCSRKFQLTFCLYHYYYKNHFVRRSIRFVGSHVIRCTRVYLDSCSFFQRFFQYFVAKKTELVTDVMSNKIWISLTNFYFDGNLFTDDSSAYYMNHFLPPCQHALSLCRGQSHLKSHRYHI